MNHYEVCHPLTEKYLNLLRTNRVTTTTTPGSRSPKVKTRRLTSVPWRLQVEGFRKLDYSS